jgi:hypothetical protein
MEKKHKLNFQGRMSDKCNVTDLLCVLATDPDSWCYQIFWEVEGLERGLLSLVSTIDRLCGLVVRVPGCRSRGPGSIPGATRFSE